jgi:hypothetical protein
LGGRRREKTRGRERGRDRGGGKGAARKGGAGPKGIHGWMMRLEGLYGKGQREIRKFLFGSESREEQPRDDTRQKGEAVESGK